MKHYIIKNIETEKFIKSMIIATVPFFEIEWTTDEVNARFFENEDIANSVIIFIGDCLDWELEQQLEIVEY